eukprot:TRINITY_DN2067_c0_g3_i2.p1 TRINITY_DN2067_c0_g3~~TRINITY_DN2067_c0_g3_i2.p1  ORF type:complete len:596 (+),score=206.68 TRINITY_DN2067_c0_g3_i2:270-1790(+)
MAEVLCYEFMTRVQAMTINVSLTGVDILAKAKTGTGKTLAFLIPSMELPTQRNKVNVLVVSPTRELAQQIADEAGQLNTFMGHHLMCVFGGVPIRGDVSQFRRSVPSILVGTPGRLNDHLANNGLAAMASSLKCLIFDEADQLLEMGFRPDITRMLGMLPSKETRQTMLFSATMPADVMTIARIALKDRFEHIDCVGEEADTHKHVPQSYTVHSMEDQFAELVSVINEGMREDDQYKMLVFFTTARLTQAFSELFNKLGYNVLEMHSRKTQPVRTATSAKFRDHTRVIMFTSDVTARGMDYPDVSKVIQVGLPADKAQYVHRLGRTARAGKSGNGVLLLCDFEKRFLNQLGDQDIVERRATDKMEMQKNQQLVNRALPRVSHGTMCAAYQAWLGFYNSNLKKLGWSREELVRQANAWITTCCLLKEVPYLQAKTVGKMNLKDTPGLRIEGRGGGGKGGKGTHNGHHDSSNGYGGKGRGNGGHQDFGNGFPYPQNGGRGGKGFSNGW